MKCDIEAIASREKGYLAKRKQKCGQVCLMLITLICFTNLSGPHRFDSLIYGASLLCLGFSLGAFCEIGTYLWATKAIKKNMKKS